MVFRLYSTNGYAAFDEVQRPYDWQYYRTLLYHSSFRDKLPGFQSSFNNISLALYK